jgi:hypothetical protein
MSRAYRFAPTTLALLLAESATRAQVSRGKKTHICMLGIFHRWQARARSSRVVGSGYAAPGEEQ